MVTNLTRWGGRLWLSYGDGNANTGPVGALTLNLTTPTVVENQATLLTEFTHRYRPFAGRLYAPFGDPREGIGNPNGSYAWTDGDGTWRTVFAAPPYGEHVGDVAVTPAGVFVAGLALLSDGGATRTQVWHSTDDAATWTTETAVLSTDTDLIDRLFVFSSGRIMAYQGGTFKLWNGTAWSDTGIPAPSGTFITERAVRFLYQGDEFYLSTGGVVTDPATSIDTAALNAAYADVTPGTVAQSIDVSEDGLHLYVLRGDTRAVWRYDQAGAHTDTGLTLESAAACIAVDEEHGLLWYGTTDSRVCAVTLP